MKTIIIGGSGFIGQQLARQLVGAGHQVTTISRSPLRPLSPQHVHRDVTLDDRRVLRELLQGADFIFHLASDTTPGSSRLQPGLEVTNNLLPLSGLLDALQESHGPVLVYISSGGAVYDTSGGNLRFSESSPTAPASYYGAGKLAAEAFIQAYRGQTGHPAVIIRPANIYGPGQIPKEHFGIVPTLCNCLYQEQPFTIWGDGSAVRDYLYMPDFLDLCGKVTRHDWRQQSLETLNAGTGQGHSILELCELLRKVSGKTLKLDHRPPRGVDLPAVTLDTGRARKLLGWQSGTSLEEGLDVTWQWFIGNQA
jgi:UDP-glucose 4-epimerase